MYGLAVGGQTGVEEVLRMTMADLDITMGLAGLKCVKDVVGKREALVVRNDA